MPQLDSITFSLQVGLFFWLFWSLYIIVVVLILPQYLLVDFTKNLLWKEISALLIVVKLYTLTIFADFVFVYNRVINSIKLYLKNLKFLRTFLTYNFLKLILKNYMLEKFSKTLNFLNIILIDNIFEQKNKWSFLTLKNSIYSFVQKYYLLKLYLKVNKTKLILNEQLEYRLEIDEVVKTFRFDKI